MIKEISYPIKYAVLELKKEGGWSNGYEDIFQGFIVSKCYVMESNIVYHSDGSNEITHKVVFPFDNISCLGDLPFDGSQSIGEENVPYYDACNMPKPVHVVTDLFDSYEEAKTIAEGKNKEYKDNLILQVSVSGPDWKKKLEKLEQKFDRALELCYLFEQLALKETDDMKISEQDEQAPFLKILKPMCKKVSEKQAE